MTNDVLVFAEHKGGVLTSGTKGAFTAAKQVAEDKELSVSAVVVGSAVDEVAKQCFTLGASKVFTVQHDELKVFRTLPFTKVLTQVIAENKPEVVLFGYSTASTDFAPRVGAAMGRAILTGAVAFEWDEDKLVATKPAYNDKLHFKYGLSEGPRMVILGLGAFSAPEPTGGATGEVVTVEPSFEDGDLAEQVLGVEMAESTVDLSAAKFIISGGRGAGSKEGFQSIIEASKSLSAQPASSRAVWDAGWTEQDIHVGQTGGTVAPDVYIAAGISGAIQHTAGIKKSKVILTINTDPEAPIWEISNYGIVGDLHKILPLLVKKLS